MNRVMLRRMPLRSDRFSALPRHVHLFLFGVFTVQLVLVGLRFWPGLSLFSNARWPDGLLLVLGAATTLASQRRHLPGQNVMLAAIVIAVIAGAMHTLGALTGVPFGPYKYEENIGQLLFYPLPWAIPVLWLVVVLTSRGVGRLILRPWHTSRNYGFWLLGLTAFLVVLFDFNLEPFATHVRHYWSWTPTKLPLDWYGAPLINFLGWALTAGIILAFATPALIHKKPAPQALEHDSLVHWLMMLSLVVAGDLAGKLWLPAAFAALSAVLVAAFAITGPKRAARS
jgi:uncharacterized membrane protein